jgi:hypothetical protein
MRAVKTQAATIIPRTFMAAILALITEARNLPNSGNPTAYYKRKRYWRMRKTQAEAEFRPEERLTQPTAEFSSQDNQLRRNDQVGRDSFVKMA